MCSAKQPSLRWQRLNNLHPPHLTLCQSKYLNLDVKKSQKQNKNKHIGILSLELIIVIRSSTWCMFYRHQTAFLYLEQRSFDISTQFIALDS